MVLDYASRGRRTRIHNVRKGGLYHANMARPEGNVFTVSIVSSYERVRHPFESHPRFRAKLYT